ncbi:Endonuclease/exonuclease/phosphatase [Croceitalea dokdonensis DOKDO 023]|uniref:Endonuclease/exonuclease/phosphatase n=2 Tax=Croceitalea TaxID=574891 RepID=A0A0P7AXS2_9FLAO|nr:Endonuclease/exonuclease/phosphatase [Croceitalea dokdonensis DOKDO 023]
MAMERITPILLLLSGLCFGQSSDKYQVRTVAFYNVENLFDTKNDTLIFDDDRTPEGAYRWDASRFQQKIERITGVISAIGKEVTKNAPDIVGLCELENREVIQAMVSHPNLKDKNYGIVHFDSPDERGIDVALLYKKDVFIPDTFKKHRLLLFDEEGFINYTRDQLVVSGLLDGQRLFFMVNHWPSRSGGEARSRPNRIKAAELNKRILDSIRRFEPDARIISMGDFNDDPRDVSFKKVLKTKGKVQQLDSTSLFNPMEKLYKKGVGSLAYRDKWNLFDQFYMTANLVLDTKGKYHFWKAGVYAPKYLKNPSGRYKGYPFRTYVGTTYQGGYADHFPVYMYLIRKAVPVVSERRR